MKKIALAVGIAFAALSAQAAEPIGKLSNVEGLVSIGGSTFVANAGNGSTLVAGSTVTVSTRGKATLMLNDGCVVPLRGGQFIALDPKLTCSQLVNSVAQLAAPYRVAQAPVGGAVVGGGAAAAGGLLVPAAIIGSIVVVGAVAENNAASGN